MVHFEENLKTKEVAKDPEFMKVAEKYAEKLKKEMNELREAKMIYMQKLRQQ